MSISYTTVNGTALAGRDYTARSGAMTFAPGETVKTVSIPILANTRVDGNRMFNLVVTPAAGIRTPIRSGVTIVDDDVPAARTLAFSRLAASSSASTNRSVSRSVI